MRAPRSLSLPVAVVCTLTLWYVFLWTMQHAPVSPSRAGDSPEGSRSRGGLSNNFASEVVRFFDDQDPREVNPAKLEEDPVFEGQIPEYLPFPDEARDALAKDLPEIFEDRSLTQRNLFRSDVDLDGDGHLDMALLIRHRDNTATGAVLRYLPKKRFSWNGEFVFAGKFSCTYEQPQDLPLCFQIFRTRNGQAHISNYTKGGDTEFPPIANDASVSSEYETRMYILDAEGVKQTLTVREPCSPNYAKSLWLPPTKDQAVDTLLRKVTCGKSCQTWRFDTVANKWELRGKDAACREEEAP